MRCMIEIPEMQEPTPDEQLKEGADMHDGLAGRTKMRDEYERPWTTKIHHTTRGGREKDAGSY